MLVRLALSVVSAFVMPSFVIAQEPAISKAKLGDKMPNLTSKDEKGKSYRLYELEKQKAIAIVFLSFECPVSRSYSEELNEIAKEFEKFGVTLWGLTTNEDDSAEYVSKMHAVCIRCGGPAHYTQRVAGGNAQIEIGDNTYEARCRVCYEPYEAHETSADSREASDAATTR